MYKICTLTGLPLFAGAVALAGPAQAAGNKPAAGKDPAQRPNIIVILVDDVGYSDFGCYGSEVPTPNIDRLAQGGLRYRTFYNNARSSPTRASLMTGLYPHQAGVGKLGSAPGHPNYQGYANEKNIFIPQALKSAGYFTVMTGKWHLGQAQGVTPCTRGFDRALNAPAGGFYFHDDRGAKLLYNDSPIKNDDPRLPKDWYSTDMWVENGLKFVDEAVSKNQPFFWYLAHNGAHFPLQAPAETIAKYRGKYKAGFEAVRNARFRKQLEMGLFPDGTELTPRNPKSPADWKALSAAERDQYDHRMAIYAAVIEELDKSTGKLIDYLEKKGLIDNTVIMIMSDNGGNAESGVPGRFGGDNPGGVQSNVWLGTPWADVANTPFFMYKHHGHQGGCCTPLIVHWPGGIDKSLNGKIDAENYGHVIDIMPTCLEIAGAKYPAANGGKPIPPMEGVSLAPTFSGKQLQRANPVMTEHEGNKMLRRGDWKIVQEYTYPAWRLYNLRNDPTEMHDLAATQPDVLKDMVAQYKRFSTRVGVETNIKFGVGQWYTPIDEYLKK